MKGRSAMAMQQTDEGGRLPGINEQVVELLHEGTIVFRTGLHSSMVEDLRTGIADAEYKVAFEIDQIRPATQEGWSVLIQGSAHFVESEAERASLAHLGVQAWASGPREQFIRIIPTHITGRRIRRTPEPAAG
jgi:hypothetical protein